jgi:DNA-binding transcriptional LysR family regulator
MIGAAASVNRPLRLRVQVWSFEAMCRMIQAGLGIGILPRKAAEVFSDTLQLRLVPLTDGWAQRQYLLCVREFKSLPAHARRLVEHFTSAR